MITGTRGDWDAGPSVAQLHSLASVSHPTPLPLSVVPADQRGHGAPGATPALRSDRLLTVGRYVRQELLAFTVWGQGSGVLPRLVWKPLCGSGVLPCWCLPTQASEFLYSLL